MTIQRATTEWAQDAGPADGRRRASMRGRLRIAAARRSVPIGRPALAAIGAGLALASAGPAAGAGAVSAFAPVGEARTSTVVPGVVYERIDRASQVVHVVRVAPGSRRALAPVLTTRSPLGRGQLDDTVRARLNRGVVAGMNGDLFSFSSGNPSGLMMLGGRPISEPEPSRSALVLSAGGSLAVARVGLSGRFHAAERDGSAVFPTRRFEGINRTPVRGSETIVYTPDLGTAQTPTGDSLFEARVRLDAPGSLTPGVPVTGVVVGRRADGGTTLGAGHVVLTGVGAKGKAIADDLALGRAVTIDLRLPGLPEGTRDAIGGGPLLVSDGAPLRSFDEGFSLAQLTGRTSRSAVGQRADGTILLVTAEGPLQGSRGVTVAEQATLMTGLGAGVAIGMDGGGSAQLAVFNRLVTPAPPARSIPNALVVSYDGVQVAPIPARLSPNGDRVDDRVSAIARAPVAGRLLLTVERRGGGLLRRLRNRPLGPGALRTDLDPARLRLPDGIYTVRARFAPADGAAPSEQRHRVIVDRTLSHLVARVARQRVGARRRPALAVAFRLHRPARATVRVTRSDGTPITTLMSGRVLTPGAYALAWDRRRRGRLISGTVRVAVESRNRLGRAGLERTVVLRAPRRRSGTAP